MSNPDELNLSKDVATNPAYESEVAAPSTQLPTLKGILANVEQAEAATAQQEIVDSITTLKVPTAGEIGDKAIDTFKAALIQSLSFSLRF